MITKILLIFLGYILMTIGITYIIIYINLLTFGYTIKEYIIFLLTRYECYLLPIGLIIEIFCLKSRKGLKK